MFINFLKTSVRYFIRNKGFSIINILGLSIGITVSIIGFLYVLNELSYDRFHSNADRIYRFSVDAIVGNTVIKQLGTPAVMARALYNDIPEIEKVTRITGTSGQTCSYGNKTFIEDRIFITDSTFFGMFTFQVIRGEQGILLNKPNTMVITATTAKKYFGHEDPIGKIISLDDTTHFKVIAVVEDVPENSHFYFDMALSLISFNGWYNDPEWFNNNYTTYIMLHKNVDWKRVQQKLPAFTNKNLFNGRYNEVRRGNNRWEFYLQPLTSIHLTSELPGESNGKKEYVYIFLIISVFILLIACINFINLATAKSVGRSREVGMRKVVGSTRPKLIRQFLTESILTSYISLYLALIFVQIILMFLPDFMGKKLHMPYFDNPFTIPLLLLLGLVIGIIAGIYPSFVLSSFKPIDVLKQQLLKGKSKSWSRNLLVVFQFTISIVLIIGTTVIYRQLNVLQNENLGFDKEQIIVIRNPGVLQKNLQPFLTSIKQYPFLKSVSAVRNLPGIGYNNWGFQARGKDAAFSLNMFYCDEGMSEVLKFEMVKGRFFSKEFATDSNAIILNEAAVKIIGWQDPIGKEVTKYDNRFYPVIGVVKDIFYESKLQKVQPMGIMHISHAGGPSHIILRVHPGDYSEMISKLEKTWNGFSPNIPFGYSFYDDDYDQLYKNEMQIQKLLLAFSFLAILIACLGLFGLASFMAQQKTKEIGIRKTVGATSFNIAIFLSRQFIRWVIIANLIAWPLAWYFLNEWLNNFAYRCNLRAWDFFIAALVSLFIALLTVSYQTYKASVANPIDAIKME